LPGKSPIHLETCLLYFSILKTPAVRGENARFFKVTIDVNSSNMTPQFFIAKLPGKSPIHLEACLLYFSILKTPAVHGKNARFFKVTIDVNSSNMTHNFS
jgi:hypothetical protein